MSRSGIKQLRPGVLSIPRSLWQQPLCSVDSTSATPKRTDEDAGKGKEFFSPFSVEGVPDLFEEISAPTPTREPDCGLWEEQPGDSDIDADVHVCDDVGVLLSPKRHKSDEVEKEQKWESGTILEAEMVCSVGTNDYTDTLHPVNVLSWTMDGLYECQLLAFKGETSIDCWPEHFLHLPREAVINRIWNIGDKVHFLWRNRNVRGDNVDGLCSKKGIWVKGTVVSVLDDGAVVKHFNWDDEGEDYVERHVQLENLRPE
jgi:hypothetical protein